MNSVSFLLGKNAPVTTTSGLISSDTTTSESNTSLATSLTSESTTLPPAPQGTGSKFDSGNGFPVNDTTSGSVNSSQSLGAYMDELQKAFDAKLIANPDYKKLDAKYKELDAERTKLNNTVPKPQSEIAALEVKICQVNHDMMKIVMTMG